MGEHEHHGDAAVRQGVPRWVAAGVALAIVCLATGCGGSGSDADGASPSARRTTSTSPGVTTTAARATTTAAPPTGTEDLRLLFALQGRSGTLDATADGGTLTIDGTDAAMVAFADRPQRLVVRLPTDGFVGRWDTAFGDDPPNAVAVEGDPDSKGFGTTTVLSLTSPSYDPDTGQLTFEVTVVGGGEAKRTFSGLSLFIDDSDLDPATSSLLTEPGAEISDPSLTGYSATTVPGWTPTDTPSEIVDGQPRQEPEPLENEQPVLPSFLGEPD